MRSFPFFLFIVLIVSIHNRTIQCFKKKDINKTAKKSLKESYNSTAANKLSDVTVSDNYSSKKWQVERVSRKQYELVNMLWKKTKIFVEVANTPVFSENTKTRNVSSIISHKQATKISQTPFRDMVQLLQPRSNLLSSTPSYIEFYYLEEDQKVNDKNLVGPKTTGTSKTHSFKELILVPRHPFFAFRLNDATCPLETKKTSTQSKLSSKVLKTTKDTSRLLNIKDELVTKSLLSSLEGQDNIKLDTSSQIDNESCRNTVEKGSKTADLKKLESLKSYKTKSSDKMISLIEKSDNNNRHTTTNDRIKFFEIYDSDTYIPYTMFSHHTRHSTNINNDVNSKDKLALEQVDKSFVNHYNVNRTRFVKKHVNYFDQREDKDPKTTENNDLSDSHTPVFDNSVLLNSPKQFNFSKPVQWSKFPYMAVYVYEPAQVRCDSAAISPHWLVAAAACLYRHHKDPQVDYRSAFVAYCSENWRHPERIAYVRRSLIHPRFHPRDNVRKHLYNIGAIQVVNSLANTCSGWSSITLISHQFVANDDGTLAAAIGWGLDRYDTSYSTMDLPKFPLMIYESLVYAKSCPGNFDYRKSKQENEDSVKNVYCLSLPTYSSEDNDAVHGALLLYGGKLIALYLQEERRLYGEQSAQYTGVWRLVPWLLDVAREPEDQDSFSFDI